jgi:hypothetical protein
MNSQVTAFDPWSCSEHDALQAHSLAGLALSEVGPYSQWRAAREVEGMRVACAVAEGRNKHTVRAISICMRARIMPPAWLGDTFAKREELVHDAWLIDWNAAFGDAWPAHTRLAAVRRNRDLKALVHAAVFDLVRRDPRAAINRAGVFAEVGAMRSINRSASSVETLYYAALNEGSLNVDAWRKAEAARSSHAIGPKAWDDRDEPAHDIQAMERGTTTVAE